jgi:predicted alpha/beta hydrolase
MVRVHAPCLPRLRFGSTAIRGHFVGLAAAIGKAGAAIGTSAFTALQVSEGKRSLWCVLSLATSCLNIVSPYLHRIGTKTRCEASKSSFTLLPGSAYSVL